MTKDGGASWGVGVPTQACLEEMLLQNSTVLQIALIHEACARTDAFCAQVRTK